MFRRHYTTITPATLSRYHAGDDDARDGVTAGYAAEPWAAFLAVLRARGIAVEREETAATGSAYVSLPQFGLRLRWSNHSRSAPVGRNHRAHATDAWEFSSKATAPERSGKFASALRSLRQRAPAP